MRYFLKNNWLALVTVTSLTLNVIIGILLYQDSKIIAINHEKNLIKQLPLDYDAFITQWGKAWLGLEVSQVGGEIAAAVRLDKEQGALVKSVAPGSPADQVNIQSGDVIVSFNGRKIRDVKQLQGDLLGSEIRTEVYMCVVKGDYTVTVYVVPEERPTYLALPVKPFPWLGVKVSEVVFGSEKATKLEEVGKAGGILVEDVMHDSPAEKADLQEGDIIMSFNSRKTRTLREFLSDLGGSDAGDQVRMCIMRDDIRKTIYVTLEKKPLSVNI